jgi:acyl-lipid omega-6 desaturase (Delta-12 desaturase)
VSRRRRELVERIRPARSAGMRRATLRLALDLSVYAGLWALLLLADSWWWKTALAVGVGIAIARLFLIGHDACHGAFFPSARWANAIAGRIVFLPSLTPYSTWELGHNTLHHGFTNLRGKDYVYTPFGKAEFEALPEWRKWLERVYRHPFGPGLHYGIEVWWRRLWFPRRPPGGAAPRAVYRWDSLLTLGYVVAQLFAVSAVARSSGQHPAALAAWAIALPFAVWSFVMGFVTYQQHTHTRVVWYAERREWDPVTAQVEGTVHILFPPPIGALLGNIMEHTAHHLDVAIPLFDLPEAQRRVENEFPEEVTVVRWSVRYYLECCRRCKLYDYEARAWTGFDGRVVETMG